VSESEIRDDLARRQWDDIDDFSATVERALADIERPKIRSTLPDEVKFHCVVDYIGAYVYWDIPSQNIRNGVQNLEAVEDSVDDNADNTPLAN
jgi:hypothetical protein